MATHEMFLGNAVQQVSSTNDDNIDPGGAKRAASGTTYGAAEASPESGLEDSNFIAWMTPGRAHIMPWVN